MTTYSTIKFDGLELSVRVMGMVRVCVRVRVGPMVMVRKVLGLRYV